MDCIYSDNMRIDIPVYSTRSIYDPADYREQETRGSNYNCGIIGVYCWWRDCIYDRRVVVGFRGPVADKHIFQPRFNRKRDKADVFKIRYIDNRIDGGYANSI